MAENTVVTIGRQYGSGGREIGKALAESLGYKFYDRDIINLASSKSGISAEILKNVDEKPTSSFLYSIVMGGSLGGHSIHQKVMNHELPLNDKLFMIQTEVIKELANESPCVIVGRCADYILRDYKNVVNVFIKADEKKRSSYYNYYTGQKWGSARNYHLSIDSKVGIDNAVKVIKSYVEMCQGKE